MTHAPESGAAMPPTEGRDTLRERIAELMCSFEFTAERMSLAEIVGGVPGADERTSKLPKVDMLLAEIETAGYRIVSADASCFEPVTDEVLMPGFDPDAYDLEAEQ